jgi:hypothetical protein
VIAAASVSYCLLFVVVVVDFGLRMMQVGSDASQDSQFLNPWLGWMFMHNCKAQARRVAGKDGWTNRVE